MQRAPELTHSGPLGCEAGCLADTVGDRAGYRGGPYPWHLIGCQSGSQRRESASEYRP